MITPPLTKEAIDDQFVADVEQRIGHGSGAWDMVDPKELIAAVVNVLFRLEK